MADFSIRFYHGEHFSASEVCYSWKSLPGSNIPMQFFKKNWVQQPGSNIPMQWEACPEICGIWKAVDGNEVILTIPDVPWESVDGDKVVIQFPKCGGETPDPEDIVVDFYEGSTMETRFQETLLFNFFHGQALGISLQTNPFVNFGIIEAWTGESMAAPVSASFTFSPNAYTGESLTSNLTTVAIPYFAPTAYTGESASGTLSTTSALSGTAWAGETLTGALTTYPSALMEPRAYAGESVSGTVQISRLFAPNIFTGESVSAELLTSPNQGMPMEVMGQGETLNANIRVSPGFLGRAYTGESLTTTLSTTTNLPINFYEGQNYVPGVEFFPPWEIQPTFYHGQALEVNLGLTYTKIINLLYTGEVMTAGLSTYPKSDFPATMYHGQVATLGSIQLPLNLANGNEFFKHGESLTVTVDEEPNIYFLHGQSMEVDLATTFSMFPRAFQEGATATVALQTRPPIYLDRTEIGNGEQMDVELKVQLHQRLYVVFRDSYVTRTDIDSSTDFDLRTTCCSGDENNRIVAGDNLQLELNNSWEQPTTRYDGDKTKVEVGFWTLPRFQVRFYEGQQTSLESHYVNLGPTLFFEGQTMSNPSADDIQNAMLCRGNFIPDADNVFIELSVDEENCSADAVFHEGTQMDIVPQFNPQMGVHFGAEHVMEFDIIVNGPYNIEFNHGTALHRPILTTDETAMRLNFYHGESAKTFSHEILFDDIHFGEGHMGIVTELTTGNSVEFLENGCLENEFVPVKESGDPDWDKFNPVPVEEDNFRHEIKVKCNN